MRAGCSVDHQCSFTQDSDDEITSQTKAVHQQRDIIKSLRGPNKIDAQNMPDCSIKDICAIHQQYVLVKNSISNSSVTCLFVRQPKRNKLFAPMYQPYWRDNAVFKIRHTMTLHERLGRKHTTLWFPVCCMHISLWPVCMHWHYANLQMYRDY